MSVRAAERARGPETAPPPRDPARGSAAADGGFSRGQIVEVQRSRLLAAAVAAVDELGYGEVTVGEITTRARVSRRTFYDLFAGREECLAAVLESVVALVAGELAAAGLGGLPWRERLRGGLCAILAFFDREPALARVCVVGVLGGGPAVLRRREEILADLARFVDEGRRERGARGVDCSALTAEGLVGAAFTILYARLLRREHEPLRGLAGELMGLLVLPYLGPAAARRERARPAPGGAPVGTQVATPAAAGVAGDPLAGVSMRLTYRTARVLGSVAELGEGGLEPSNREVARHAGIADQGQVSKLLARLERVGLLANAGGGHAKGEPNAWRLTPTGERVAQSIRAHRGAGRRAA